MPNRNIEGNYRYKFQGQEKDPETGKEAFQLRLWDGRIGRWLTTDPYGQYSSPYLGMGNDPINGIDPDGGYKTKIGAILGWIGGGFKGKISRFGNPATPQHKYGIKSSSIIDGAVVFNTNFGSGTKQLNIDSGHTFERGFFEFRGTITATSGLQDFQFWRNKPADGFVDFLAHTGTELTFGTVENVFSVFSGGRTFTGEVLQGDHRTNAGMEGLITVASFGYGGVTKSLTSLKSTPALYNQFAKNTKGLFKGSNHAQLRSTAYKNMIKNHNSSVKEMKHIFNDYNSFSTDLQRAIELINQSQLKD